MIRNRIVGYLAAAVAVAAISVGGGFLGARLGRDNVSETDGALLAQPAAGRTDVLFEPVDAADVATAFQERFRTVAGQTLPVVVEVNVMNRVSGRQQTPLEFFFGNPRNFEPREEFLQEGMGSGVIVGREGRVVYVVTNEHVAGDATEIELVLYDGRSYDAELVGADELMDIALLSFTTNDDVPIATFGDSETLQAGDWVFAVGNPLGFESTVTAGIVSATGRIANSAQLGRQTDYIQTDAAINRGNSGGALVNLSGEVIGINTWIASQTGGSIGLGFAIPVNNVRRAINDLAENGEVTYSWLGVSVGTVTEEIAESLGVTDDRGAFIAGVYDGSPAEAAGLMPGDVVLRIGDVTIADSGTLVRVIGSLPPTQRTEFQIVRDGNQQTVWVTTERRSEESFSSTLWPGIDVGPITEATREQLNLPRRTEGVVARQVTSVSQESGLRPGDLITAVNGESVESLRDFYRSLRELSDDEIQFRVIREGRTLILGFVRSTM